MSQTSADTSKGFRAHRFVRKAIAGETVAAIRRQYVDGVPVPQICRQHGVGQRAVYRCVDGRLPEHPELEPLPRRSMVRPTSKSAPTGIRRLVVEKIWRTVRRQVNEIEARLKKIGQQPIEPEARALAMLVKTLRELSAFDELRREPEPSRPTTEAEDDDPIPEDIDEFRRELARRMEAYVRSRSGDGVSGG